MSIRELAMSGRRTDERATHVTTRVLPLLRCRASEPVICGELVSIETAAQNPNDEPASNRSATGEFWPAMCTIGSPSTRMPNFGIGPSLMTSYVSPERLLKYPRWLPRVHLR